MGQAGPRRAGERWNGARIAAQLEEIAAVRDIVTLSGGWAWHFMSPAAHAELKAQHDHKDVDVFVRPKDFESLRETLLARGFRRIRTKYDQPSGRFYRFSKPGPEGKIVFDTFIDDVPVLEIDGFRVVSPEHLLTLYGTKHTSGGCWAVRAARLLLARGVSPVGRPELVQDPRSLESRLAGGRRMSGPKGKP